jgi:hypothetical protein
VWIYFKLTLFTQNFVIIFEFKSRVIYSIIIIITMRIKHTKFSDHLSVNINWLFTDYVQLETVFVLFDPDRSPNIN